MIVKTEAIVLKRIKFGDTSRIVSLLTKDYGRLSVIAKGVRTPRSKLGPVLDALNHVQVVLYKKEGRDLHLISQCDLLTRFSRLTADLHRLGCAMSVLDYVSVSSREGGENLPLFLATLDSLSAIDTERDPYHVLLYFQMRLLGVLGFQPDFLSCVGCKREFEEGGTKNEVFRLTPDGILCPACNPLRDPSIQVDCKALSTLRTLQGMQPGWHLSGGELPSEGYRGARQALSHLLRTHVDGVSTMRSGPVLSSMIEQTA